MDDQKNSVCGLGFWEYRRLGEGEESASCRLESVIMERNCDKLSVSLEGSRWHTRVHLLLCCVLYSSQVIGRHPLRLILQGHLDTILNSEGERQADLVAKALRDVPFDVCYSSDPKLATVTAK